MCVGAMCCNLGNTLVEKTKAHLQYVEEKASSTVPFWKKAIKGTPRISSWISYLWENLQHFGGSSPWNQQCGQCLPCFKCYPVSPSFNHPTLIDIFL